MKELRPEERIRKAAVIIKEKWRLFLILCHIWQ